MQSHQDKLSERTRQILRQSTEDSHLIEERLAENPIAQLLVEKIFEVMDQTAKIISEAEQRAAATEKMLSGDAPQTKKKQKRRRPNHREQLLEEKSMAQLSTEDKEQMVAAVLREH